MYPFKLNIYFNMYFAFLFLQKKLTTKQYKYKIKDHHILIYLFNNQCCCTPCPFIFGYAS